MSGNASLLHLSSNSYAQLFDCTTSKVTVVTFITFSITNILIVLPIFALVLYLGFQRWRKPHHISTSASAASSSDIFTYHIVVMEMIMILGCLSYCVGSFTDLKEMIVYGLAIFISTWSIKTYFHTLTCVAHYLAVVHPVTYLCLRNRSGVRIRNVCIGCVWLLCFGWGVLVTVTSNMVIIIVYFCLVGFALILVSFCCISVLCALRHPGPGQLGSERERVNQMKRRAFNNILTIMGVLLLCLGGMLVSDVLLATLHLNNGMCAVMSSTIWFSLPTSLVLPLLYLHRAGKLPSCKYNTE